MPTINDKGNVCYQAHELQGYGTNGLAPPGESQIFHDTRAEKAKCEHAKVEEKNGWKL